MPIKLSFLWCLQVTSKYLCVFSGGKWTEAEGIIHICIMKGKQMPKHRKSLSGIKQNDSIWCLLVLIDMYSQMSMDNCAHWYK